MTALKTSSTFPRDTLAISCLCLLALCLRILGIDRQSYWLDEGIELRLVTRFDSAGGLIQHLRDGGDVHPPLYHLFMSLWTDWFSITSETAMRMPSAVASALIVPVVFVLAKELGTKKPLLAPIIVAVSPLEIWYGQEVRMYAFAGLFGSLAAVAAIKAHRTDQTRWWSAFVLFGVLGAYTHIYCTLLLIPVALLLIRSQRTQQIKGAIAIGLQGLVVLPWLLVILGSEGVAGVEHGSPLLGLPYTVFTFFYGVSLGPSIAELHDKLSVGHELPLLTACGIVILAVAHGMWTVRSLRSVRVASLFLFVPLFVAVTGALVSSNVSFNVRYVLVVYPFFAIMLSESIVQLSKRRADSIAISTLTILVAWSLINFWTSDRYVKEDYRSAVEYMKDHPVEGGHVLSLTSIHPLVVYADRALDIQRVESTTSAPDLRAADEGHREHYVFVAREWEIDGGREEVDRLLMQTTVVDHQRFPGVELYRVRS